MEDQFKLAPDEGLVRWESGENSTPKANGAIMDPLFPLSELWECDRPSEPILLTMAHSSSKHSMKDMIQYINTPPYQLELHDYGLNEQN